MLASMPPIATLFIAILCEVFATSWLPKTAEFTQPVPTVIVLACYIIAFYALSVTVQTMPLGVAYAIWCGAGIVLVTMIGWLVYDQKLDLYAIIGLGLILLGTVIINVFSNSAIHK